VIRVIPRVQTDGQTDITKLIVALRSFENAPTNLSNTRSPVTKDVVRDRLFYSLKVP
jgi:hypothetical protein